MTPQMRRRHLKQAPNLLSNILARGRYDYTSDLMPMQSAGMSLRKRLNLLRSGMNVIHRRLTPWSMPINLQVEPTNRCNLKCPVCPCGSDLTNRPRGDMDLDLYRRLMDEVGDPGDEVRGSLEAAAGAGRRLCGAAVRAGDSARAAFGHGAHRKSRPSSA